MIGGIITAVVVKMLCVVVGSGGVAGVGGGADSGGRAGGGRGGEVARVIVDKRLRVEEREVVSSH